MDPTPNTDTEAALHRALVRRVKALAGRERALGWSAEERGEMQELSREWLGPRRAAEHSLGHPGVEMLYPGRVPEPYRMPADVLLDHLYQVVRSRLLAG